MSRLITALAVGLSAAAFGAAAHAQNAPPAWDTLVRCAQTPDEAARLACYDSAMRLAGYAPNPAAVNAEHRKAFGLTVPKVNVFKRHKREEGAQSAGAAAPPPETNLNRTEITIDQVALAQPGNRVIVFTNDGQIWQQTDTTEVSQYPKAGETMMIRREALGGYFCDVNKYQTVRCKRYK